MVAFSEQQTQWSNMQRPQQEVRQQARTWVSLYGDDNNLL